MAETKRKGRRSVPAKNHSEKKRNIKKNNKKLSKSAKKNNKIIFFLVKGVWVWGGKNPLLV